MSGYRIEFFSNPAGTCDPSGHGEGFRYLGYTEVDTDSAGHAGFAVDFPLEIYTAPMITATATDASGNTSEFSECMLAIIDPNSFGQGADEQVAVPALSPLGMVLLGVFFAGMAIVGIRRKTTRGSSR